MPLNYVQLICASRRKHLAWVLTLALLASSWMLAGHVELLDHESGQDCVLCLAADRDTTSPVTVPSPALLLLSDSPLKDLVPSSVFPKARFTATHPRGPPLPC